MNFANMIVNLLGGLAVSVEIFVATLAIALPLGFLIAFGRMSRNSVLAAVFRGYISIVRGTPLMLQIMFIYFGLLPDIAIMAVGLVFEQPLWAAVGCTVINILLGLLFFGLTPLLLEPKEGKAGLPEPAFAGDLKVAKKRFSRLGLGAFVILVVGSNKIAHLMGEQGLY